jgi:hypothetical protein
MRHHPPFNVYCETFDDVREEGQEEEDDSSGIDVLTELGITHNYSPVLRNLLSYLDPLDLTQACRVSRNWNQVITSDKKANHRRKKYLQEMKKLKSSIGKENWPMKDDTEPLIQPLSRHPLAPRLCNHRTKDKSKTSHLDIDDNDSIKSRPKKAKQFKRQQQIRFMR